jgi:hypothetical protein
MRQHSLGSRLLELEVQMVLVVEEVAAAAVVEVEQSDLAHSVTRLLCVSCGRILLTSLQVVRSRPPVLKNVKKPSD